MSNNSSPSHANNKNDQLSTPSVSYKLRKTPTHRPNIEETMVKIREKFDKLKVEVDAELGIFAGDMVNILEKTSDSHREWKESLEDLVVIARQCAKMSPNEFWAKSEIIVQNLDDKRQELRMGIIKQAHKRLLCILTRCTRLAQFQKEYGYEEDHILGFHQLSDLGVYPKQMSQTAHFNYSGQLVIGEKPSNI